MKDKYKFFENKECEYYPCHKGLDQINCLFCFCPLYSKEHCPGQPQYIEVNNKMIKDCSECTFAHNKDHYDLIMQILSK